MALRFIDSAAHYATGQAQRKWTSDSGDYRFIPPVGIVMLHIIQANGNALLKTLTHTIHIHHGFRAQVSAGQYNIMTALAMEERWGRWG